MGASYQNGTTDPRDLESLLVQSVEAAHARKAAPVVALATPEVPSAAPVSQPSAVRFSPGPLGELFAAMAAAQAEMGHAIKNGDNPFFGSRYADLAACIDVARGPLSRHGIAVFQMPWTRAGNAVVTTRFGHSSGQWCESDLELPPQAPKKKFNGRGGEDELPAAPGVPTPHAYGSAFSFARRYAYSAITGLATADDDGNAATFSEPEPEQQPRAVRTVPARAPRVDIGNNPPNSKGAQQHVAARKLDALRAESAERGKADRAAEAAAAVAPELGTKGPEISAAFAGLRERMGPDRYNAELAAAGVRDPLDLRAITAVRELYARMVRAAEVA